ncbi:hypothetical protein L596_018830 [Steinernema carpocapsae]|uniref:Cytosolic endo-beta-N-acetylglucosaminidase TIM barrel domain-containing protein n=1 Tax=Steinernema carpocapsae TaxID=34508 RepID=A0A4U5N6M3_STECR|nr:hypothetical protein L596_018830 [Steinernema carpocapsae]
MIVWYDSVTTEGELKWQDELNEKNRIWFDCVDAIYLNYCWNEEKLARSREAAGERNHDVFAGVDCFGRGCFGGGQWNCKEAVKAIEKEDLSCALFAPGWIAECFPESCVLKQSVKFWDLLAESLPCRSMEAQPFKTRFGVGFTDKKFCIGSSELQPILIAEGRSNPLTPTLEGFKVEQGSYKLFRFHNFPKKARIFIEVSEGDVSLQSSQVSRIEKSVDGTFLVECDSGFCEIGISTEAGCMLKSFELH